ncbi:MAG: Ig-like domain-containing protein, partial [Bacteroidota bacterium]
GRNTGGVSWNLNQVKEDPMRLGFADPINLSARANQAKNNYANQTHLHPYAWRNELIVGGQQKPFFPDGTPTGQGWALASGTATGEYMGRYLTEFFGGNGQPAPKYLEIMNEPLWEFVTIEQAFTPTEIFEFHNQVVDQVRRFNQNIPIGGYVTAFPDFEKNNFQRWKDRWQLFMDMSGDKMDFWSIHLYDFNLKGGQQTLRRGSNLEATFDMMDHYSYLSFGKVKPYIISEYGGRAHDLEKLPWSPRRDWLTMKSMSSMLLSFMDRPDLMWKTIPFITIKAEWGRTDVPYPWRLMRQAFEGENETGNHWVYTELVKFYQLWSEVKGLRIDTWVEDPDIQTKAFVNENKLYIILNNLEAEAKDLSFLLKEIEGNTIQQIEVKQLYGDNEIPKLETQTFNELSGLTIEPSATIIIEYTFNNNIAVQEQIVEQKYFAKEHLTAIVPYFEHQFHLDNVEVPIEGVAFLRLGMGRPHGVSLSPKVTINGFEVSIPEDYAGDDQLSRETWFGLKEIPIPLNYLKPENTIGIQFTDLGGHISSLGLRTFSSSQPLQRSQVVPIQGIELNPDTVRLLPGNGFQYQAAIVPLNSTSHQLLWTSSDTTIVSVDQNGAVTTKKIGTATITTTTPDGQSMANSLVEVLATIPTILPTSLVVQPASFELNLEANEVQLSGQFFPQNAVGQELLWSSSDRAIAQVDTNGRVTAINAGTVEIIAKTVDGTLSSKSQITVQAPLT